MTPPPLRRRAAGALAAVAATLVACLPSAVHAQGPSPALPDLGETETQTLAFEAGPNFVSLRVRPPDARLDALLGPFLKDLVLAKDAAGTTFAPGFGVADLEAWPWGESLVVIARAPFSVDVTGSVVLPSTRVPLAAGWNWVPSFVDAPTSPGQAFASIAESLVQVEDRQGRRYPSADGGEPLAAVVPGVGYRVKVSAPDTLVYVAPPPSGPPPVAVATVLDAIELRGLAVGDRVAVEGYRRPGDGGAGVLRVTDSACAPDGGTCFVPTEYTEEATATGLSDDHTLYTGASGGGVAFESFQLIYGPGDDNRLGALALHGHASGRGDVAGEPLLNTLSGRLIVPSGLRDLARDLTGSNRVAATYRYATQPIRLERTVQPIVLEGVRTTDYVRPEWWGAAPYPDGWTPDTSAPSAPRARPSGVAAGDATYDATDPLATAINAAEAKAARARREHYVVLRGMYGYARVIEMQDRVVLKGERDGVRDGQGLRVLKGAPWHYWAVKGSRVDPSYSVEPSARDHLLVSGDPFVVVRHGRRSQLDRVVDVEFDGNLTENEYVFTPAYRAASGGSRGSWSNKVEEMLQNTAHWNGFVASHQHADVVPGSNARLVNVHIHDYGGNLILGGEAIHFGGSSDLLLGNTIKNHHLYRVFTAPGTTVDRIELYGYSWAAHMAYQQGHYRDVVFRDLVRNPRFGQGNNSPEELIGHRNDGVPESALFDRSRADGYYFGDEAVLENVRFELSADFRPRSSLVSYDTGPLALRGVTLDVEGSDPVSLMNRGSTERLDRAEFVVEDVRVVRGQVRSLLAPTALRTSARQIGPFGGDQDGQGVQLSPFRQGHTATFYDVGGGVSGDGARAPEVVKIVPFGSDSTASLDVFVQRARFTGVRSPVMMTRLDPSEPDVSARYRVFWRDVDLSRWRDSNNDRGTSRESGKLQYFDRVTVGDRTSEASGTLSSTPLEQNSNGTGYVDVDPELFYIPQDPSYVTVGGRDAGRFLGWDNVGSTYDPVLRLSFSGTGPVTATWTAAIRPIPDGVIFPE